MTRVQQLEKIGKGIHDFEQALSKKSCYSCPLSKISYKVISNKINKIKVRNSIYFILVHPLWHPFNYLSLLANLFYEKIPIIKKPILQVQSSFYDIFILPHTPTSSYLPWNPFSPLGSFVSLSKHSTIGTTIYNSTRTAFFLQERDVTTLRSG